MARHGADSSKRRGDGHLWVIALGLSVVANLGLLILGGYAVLEAAVLRQKSVAATPPPSASVVMIFPETVQAAATPDKSAAPASTPTTEAAPAAPAAQSVGPRFARTSADQSAPRPDRPALLGERNTRATSERAPQADAPPLPSQAGVAPRDASQIETTHSDYQDGHLDADPNTAAAAAMSPAPPPPETPLPLAAPLEVAAKPSDPPAPDPAASTPPPRAPLAGGPNPVDVPVPRELAKTPDPQTPPKPVAEATPPRPSPANPPQAAQSLQPPSPKTPGFKGFQRKTAVVGSISRTGRSALDVADSPLGRYQAALSRAVEQEWQRNCVRHRDFITPGFLTVRFFVAASGKVRSVQFVGDMETGEVQKGFTLNAIRDAEIPAMPAALRREYDQEPLELIFRFYF